MALIKENDLTEGMSGKFGKKIVFRVVRGVTVATRRSTTERVPTEKQLAHQERFRKANQYARAKMLDPIAKAEYKLMAGNGAFSSAFTTAVGDFLALPKVLEANTTGFTGDVGSTIAVLLSDNFKTIRVKIDIRNIDGALVESGEASIKAGDTEWKYVTTQALPSLTGVKIVVTAIDRPGNETIFEKLLV